MTAPPQWIWARRNASHFPMDSGHGWLRGILICVSWYLAQAHAGEPPKAARSVHLGWPSEPVHAFYLEMAIQKSTSGSYFMACGWNTGYFGLQELYRGGKVAIFSVWDPTTGDDPASVPTEERVELLHQGEGARIRRFGGEGTGGQCMIDFDWKLGQTNRFLVVAGVEGQKTAYSGYLHDPAQGKWRHLVTFRTRTQGALLKGLYSFVEDFRRDTKSVGENRRALFGHGWVLAANDPWKPLITARFTASGAEWESKENIDAGTDGASFFLATGGSITRSRPLNSTIQLDWHGGQSRPGDLPSLRNDFPKPIVPKPVELKAR